ncbi:hypothetical protein [Actinopolymorpha alba]|uniref:hypothetical protein n=1 Tax=Actinopolymorpha alba TaxID=533267 RepID=UPI00037C469F|nr:hypothetical protein [Actinopolymorpha alba]
MHDEHGSSTPDPDDNTDQSIHAAIRPNRRSILAAMGTGAIAAATGPVVSAPPAAASVRPASASPVAAGVPATAVPPAAEVISELPLVGGEEFPIGLWWPPPPFETTLERYQEIKDAGFTYTHSNNYLFADAHIQRYALSIAEQVGLQLVVDDPTIRWLRSDFDITSAGGDFTLTPAQASTKTRQVLDLYRPRSYWSIQDGRLLQNGGTSAGSIGLSREGGDWSDYAFAFDVAPRQTGGGGSYAQSGWAFRAKDQQNAYVWLLSNFRYTSQGAPGYLAKALFVNGNPVWVRPVPLDFAVTAGTSYHVELTVSGDTFTTSINGQLVDTTTDSTYRKGRVGFREAGTTSSLYDNVKVTAPDGTILLADDFSGDLGKWNAPSAGGYRSFVGIDVYDEPSANKFETLGQLVEIIRALDPKALPYINLFPTTDPNYVRQFVDIVKPVLISFDRYPLLTNGRDDANYFLNWKIVRDAGLAANLPTWIFIQTLSYANHREPTASEILWQINVSLAYGAKGIQYFTYWTPDPARGEGFGPALITVDGERTVRYDSAKEINNGWLAPVGRELKPLVSESVTHANESPLPAGAAGWTADEYVRAVQGDPLILGRFRDTDPSAGTRWLLLANRAHFKRCKGLVDLNASTVREVARFDPASQSYAPQKGPRLSVDLEPGAAVLYRLRTR